jgi:hypothetical protein
VIAKLDARRHDTLRELKRLHGELASTIEEHKPGSHGPSDSERRQAKAAAAVAKSR